MVNKVSMPLHCTHVKCVSAVHFCTIPILKSVSSYVITLSLSLTNAGTEQTVVNMLELKLQDCCTYCVNES